MTGTCGGAAVAPQRSHVGVGGMVPCHTAGTRTDPPHNEQLPITIPASLIRNSPFGSQGRNVLGRLILLAQGGKLGLLPFAVENIGIVFSKGSAGLTR